MDTPTKQRLVGAAVLIALAVIFLPMVVKGPAPDSGVSDVPLEMPEEPAGDMETRDLPLMTPQAGADGVLGSQTKPAPEGEQLPTVDTSDAADPAMQPASVAGGNYAVHFGTYASSADAQTIVGQLRAAKLAGYSEETTLNGRKAWRVRIGPYAGRADAEAARLSAAQVRDDVGARVVVLDAETAPAAAPAPRTETATASKPVAKPATPEVKTEALPAPKPVAAAPAPAPAAPAPAPAKEAPKPAASGTGFVVQLGAFGNAQEAGKLRDRLRAAGFTAFTETVKSDKGALTRVSAGPVLTRAEADRLRGQISAKAGVSGMVRSHP